MILDEDREVLYQRINKRVDKMFDLGLYDEVISSAIDFFNGLGIESRFLTSLSEGSITESAGRERIFEVIIEAIKQNPFGYGFFADRYVIVSSGMRNAYTHNFFLEVICDFGVIFGSVFIIFFIWRMLNTIHYFKSTSMNKIISALIPFGLFQLLFSSSFLVCPPFFMLMGIFFFTNFQQKSDWRLQ